MSRIHIRIDRLVLNGSQPGQDKALVEALRTQLSQILANRVTRREWGRSHRTPVLRLGRMVLEPGASGGAALGKNMARAIGRVLKP